MAKTKKRELRVVFDTSVLFTQSFGELINPEASTMIATQSKHLDLVVTWYLPEIVRNERQYQIEQTALELLPSIRKVEKLLGNNLNITAENLSHRVTLFVDQAVKQFQFEVLKMDVHAVEWIDLMRKAAFRIPPFQAGKGEKGFRDSMILEDFMQLLENSPKNPAACRVVLVAQDLRLIEAAQERIREHQNARVVPSIEELQGLINTLVSQVSEEVVADIKTRASAFFFEEKDDQTFYYREKLHKKILDRFSKELTTNAPGASSRENGTWYISSPEFVKKEAQTFFWKTRIKVEAKAYKFETTKTALGLGDLTKPSNASQTGALSLAVLGTTLLGSGSQKIEVATGSTKLDIHWSVRVDTKKRLSNAQIQDIEHLDTTWGQD